MRISTALLTTSPLVFGAEKKVPPRHPKSRLRTLVRFSEEWLENNFRNLLPTDHKGEKNGNRIADRFSARFTNWTTRLQGLIDDSDKDCFFFDPNAPHGGRTRRDDDYDYSPEADDLLRYDEHNPQRGLRQITTGFRKWALRYISDCPGEKNKKAHSKRADRLYRKILQQYNDFFNKFKSDE